MRILQVASGMPNWGGIETHIIDVSLALQLRSHHVTVACQPESEIERRSLAIGLPTVRLTTNKQHDWSQFPQFVRALAHQYDVVHVHFTYDYIVPAAAARLVRIPVVVMTRHAPSRIRNAMLAYSCGNLFYDRIIAVSDYIREILIEDLVSPDRIVVVKNGIDPKPWLRGANANLREELHIPSSAFVVAAAGRLMPYKGFDVLIRAVAAAGRAGLDLFCVIAGAGEELGRLEELIKELDVRSTVQMLGFREDVPAIFGAADVVAVPSTASEAFGYTALEALACGRPVIGSRVGGISEVITEEVGCLISPGDVEALTAAIVQLARDDEKRRIMGSAALIRAKDFTLDKCVDGIEKVYEALYFS